MPKLKKNTIAQTFKFDCDRYLRFRLASDGERSALNLDGEKYKRPGIDLMQIAGHRWEIDKYQDLINTAGARAIEFREESEVDGLIGRRPFKNVENLYDILRRPIPPLAIIEGEFPVPSNMTSGLQRAHDLYNLEPVKARPDIMWIRKAPTGAPLISSSEGAYEYEIHIVDVKMAAEPSLKHFTEVTFYALALAKALELQGLSSRYAVSAQGFIWPGSHDANEFRNRYQELLSRGVVDPITEALQQTLISVPYEVYQVHVKQFFEERLLKVLAQPPLQVEWHVAPKCQFCEYLEYCKEQAAQTDQLSRVPWLNQGQAELLRKYNIHTTRNLAAAIQENAPEWQEAKKASHQLRADERSILARLQALQSDHPVIMSEQKTALMPRWSHLNIFVTVHFDPGTGITFALGASRVYFQESGKRPVTDESVFVVDRVDNLSPDTERARLIEFVRLISGWLEEVSDCNATVAEKQQKHSAHIFFWDALELKQLRRMLERHMGHPDVIELIELLIRLFPPENFLPDPDLFRSQPGTVVKGVIKRLVGLPLAHDYTLIDTANTFYPSRKGDGTPFLYNIPFGFGTPMSDQIPFERAYELWEDRILLKQYNPHYPNQPDKWSSYTRDDIYEGIKRTVTIHMAALQQIVSKLREYCKDQLMLRKSGFSAAPPTQTQVPEKARSLIAFAKLNSACNELENRQNRALPVEEREARFISMRGLSLAIGQFYEQYVRQIRTAHPQYANRGLMVFTFASTSRDARIKERDFLLALSNEGDQLDLDVPLHVHLELTYQSARDMLLQHGITEPWVIKSPLTKLLQVEVIRLEPTQDPPFLILAPVNPLLFQFAQDQEILDLSRPMIIDPFFQDFDSDKIEQVLRNIGGTPPPLRRRRKS